MKKILTKQKQKIVPNLLILYFP